ncbi:MAG: hypothetical protein BMS9Abin12_0588 [Acidimicrobiia bacterium]|nr:MAG: hypothetical protein BMS9Abin12_0588 [Acidimicrobiia bacterium]
MSHNNQVTWDKPTLDFLLPVIESTRRELADMEPDDIPAGLRKVAKSSARSLPPPFARSVVQELIDNEPLRDATRVRLESLVSIDADLVTFLDDPVVGLETIAGRVHRENELAADNDLVSANQQIAILNDQLAEAKRRLADTRSEHTRELRETRKSLSDGQKRIKARNGELREIVEVQRSEIRSLTEKVAGLHSDVSEIGTRLEAATVRVRRRSEANISNGRALRADTTPADPLEFARWLDVIERNARPFRARSGVEHVPAESLPLRVPPGVAPDSGPALASLIEQSPTRIVIDGYNVAGAIHGERFSTRDARDDVVGRAGRLARSTTAEILVVFDGPDADGSTGFQSTAGVSVRFSRGDEADDVIADLVRTERGRTIVITNDRELRDRCTIEGCVPVWATAFVEWG